MVYISYRKGILLKKEDLLPNPFTSDYEVIRLQELGSDIFRFEGSFFLIKLIPQPDSKRIIPSVNI